MQAFHIHITGLVQGVGFRPYVHKLASKFLLDGYVNNGLDGVHIYCSGNEDDVNEFYQSIILHPPVQALITSHQIMPYPAAINKGFFIQKSARDNSVQLLITPDITLCEDCRREIKTNDNKRYQYPFTTCVNCGPRYSITNKFPYDRENTTMQTKQQCNSCKSEYEELNDSRYHSQTNSCSNCCIEMHLFEKNGIEIKYDQDEYITHLVTLLREGKIVAVKGIGGYLLLCDATNAQPITILRARKFRPSKPFAVLYADIEMVCADLAISPLELTALKDRSAPIVLCSLKSFPENGICTNQIAPNLDSIGAMLPSSALLQLIADHFGKPLIATSANISGAPIVYKDNDAVNWLSSIADFILTYDREIVAPQDDSVLQISHRGQKIILRRSRGLAPNYYPLTIPLLPKQTLAMGAELKAAFAISKDQMLFISQFLGDQGSVESQESFDAALKQVSGLLDFEPSQILIDKHPRYYVSEKGLELSMKYTIPIYSIQHHEAHFAAVLAENKLLDLKEPILGIIWDGAGFGTDGQIWGGEVFIYDQGEIKRAAHLKYFPQLMGDKMSKEPRLSALSILQNQPLAQNLIQKYFTPQEWVYYQQVIRQPNLVYTSSMGRLIDAVACILGIMSVCTYEGESAMLLEALAKKCKSRSYDYYHLPLNGDEFDWTVLINELIHDWSQKEANEVIAWKFFYSLAKAIARTSNHFFIDKIAFSGGVFQNALLVDMIIEILQHKRQIYFHIQLSPNDECISMGQMAWFSKFGNNIINETTKQPDYPL
jgi:hydrogenase maturation protein HypF